MAQDLLTTYKYGWKTSYYQNTYDAKKDADEPAHPIGWHDDIEEDKLKQVKDLLDDILTTEEEDCDACKL